MKKKILTIITILGIVIINAQITNGLVGDYSFNGNTYDSSPMNNTSSNYYSYNLVEDRNGNLNSALTFDTAIALGYAEYSPFVGMNDSMFTVSLWYKQSTQTPLVTNFVKTMVSGNNSTSNSYGFDIQALYTNPSFTSSKISMFVSGAGGVYTGVHLYNVDANWHHYAFTFKQNDSIHIYQDGIKVSSAKLSFSIPLADIPNNLGLCSSDTNHNNYGSVYDDLKIYNRVLSDIEINSLFTGTPPPCTVNIPDAIFKNALLNHNPVIDINNNGEIECSEAQNFVDTLNLEFFQIANLSGLESFVNITGLILRSNSDNIGSGFISLDLTSNVNLQYLDCSFNAQLTSVNVSNCSQLKTLIAQRFGAHNLNTTNNALLEVLFIESDSVFNSSIDLSNNDLIKSLNLPGLEITSIDLSQMTSLTHLDLNNTLITNIDITNNPELEVLTLTNTNVASIDFSNQQKLERLYMDAMDNLTSVDLSNSDSLQVVFIRHAPLIQNIDLSNNPNLTFVSIRNDLGLETLNVKNGNNGNITGFWCTNNPLLTCVEVDDSSYSNTNWTNIDSTINFSENCGVVTPILVNSITINAQNNFSTITTNGGTLQMEATVLPMNATDGTYTWSVVNGTGSATIDANGLLTATADGTVEVIATANDASGTMGTKTITISNQSVSINDLAFENVRIYPNPTNGTINLNVSETLSSVRIMDLTGKTFKVFNAESKQLDLSEFTIGIYFLEIVNAERKSVVKIIKR